jgi:hypothetical protein
MEKRTVQQNGGKREGAGRKKAGHTVAAEKAREYLITAIAEQLGPIVSAQIEAAKGLFYEGKEGKVYTKIPDVRVGEYLLNQIAGKAKEKVEEVPKDERPFIIRLNR